VLIFQRQQLDVVFPLRYQQAVLERHLRFQLVDGFPSPNQ